MNIMENHHQGPLTTTSESDKNKHKKIHFMKISTSSPTSSPAALIGSPHRKKLDWDPHMTMTSPVEWETSPLVSHASSDPDGDSGPSSPIHQSKHNQGSQHKPDIVLQWEDKQHLPDVISNNEATTSPTSHQHQQSEKVHEPTASSRKPSIQHYESMPKSSSSAKERSKVSPTTYHQNGVNGKLVKNNTNNSKENFIIVNVPENVFAGSFDQQHNTINHLDANKNNLRDDTLLSIADDTATVVSEGVKCRYCLINDTMNNEPLISPCHCCGTSKFVHQSCLEKWLTLRNLDSCEVCKMQYRTKWVHRPLCSVSFCNS